MTTFVAAAVIAGSGALTRPTQSALIPAMASEPSELVGANVATSLFEGIGTFVGPLVAGLVLGSAGAAPAAVVAAVGFAVATAAGLTLHVSEAARPPVRTERVSLPLRAGWRALRDRPAARALLGSLLAQVFVRGLLTTLIVVLAVETLGLGDPGVGGLNAALGAGGIIGAGIALTLARRRRFAPFMALALIGWGLPIAIVGLAPVTAVAFGAMVVVGLSNVVLDVVAYTLLQRTIPSGERTAVFALLEGCIGLGVTAGGLAAPVLIGAAGVTGALIVTGSILPIVALLGWRRIRTIDDERAIPDDVADALRADPLLRRLPLAALERVGADATAATFGAGEALMLEGEIGDRYYVITAGEVEVTQGGVVRRRCGAGEGVGEIALLRAVPRSATVTALTKTSVLEIPCAAFHSAMTGHEVSGEVAASVMADRLADPAGDGAGDGGRSDRAS